MNYSDIHRSAICSGRDKGALRFIDPDGVIGLKTQAAAANGDVCLHNFLITGAARGHLAAPYSVSWSENQLVK